MIIHMKRRGFTIIELIIVVTIMGILLTIGVVNLRGSQANGRDAERKVDVDTIALHLETYYTSGIDNTSIPFSATGGTITTSGNYTIHTFTSTGQTFTPNIAGNVEILVVAGGGGGGSSFGGGGGAGGLKYDSSFTVTAQAYTVTVGGGGSGAAAIDSGYGSDGANSIFSSITASGGGGGGAYISALYGRNGGSGGGGGSSETSQTQAGGTGIAGQGYAGGYGYGRNGYLGGGGGGAGGLGGNAVANSVSGSGGLGFQSSISGTATFYASGGSGGSYTYANGTTVGTVSPGGGALGVGTNAGRGNNATSNTGGGGGGGGYPSGGGGNGGSGIVIIRYLTPVSGNTHTVTYPSTALTATTASMIQMLRDIDTKSITAPGITDPTLTFISATNNIQTAVGVLPQPTKDQYVYQPIHSDGSLCNDAAECRKFNLYYKLENATTDCPAPNNICMITSRNQ